MRVTGEAMPSHGLHPPQFADLIAAIGNDRLREAMARRQWLHVPAQPGQCLASWFGWAALESVLASGRVAASSIRLFAGRRPLDPVQMGLVDGDVVNPALARWGVGQRATLVFSDLDRCLPALGLVAADAAAHFDDRVRLGAIASYAGDTGLPPHYDRQSTILIQIEGSKQWLFFGDPVVGSTRGFRDEDWDPSLPVSGTVQMNPGDVLYVPSGQHHMCVPLDRSLHLGLLIGHQSAAGLTAGLTQMIQDDPLLAAPLVRFLGDDAVNTQVTAYKARLLQLLTDADPRALLDARQRARLRDSDPGG